MWRERPSAFFDDQAAATPAIDLGVSPAQQAQPGAQPYSMTFEVVVAVKFAAADWEATQAATAGGGPVADRIIIAVSPARVPVHQHQRTFPPQLAGLRRYYSEFLGSQIEIKNARLDEVSSRAVCNASYEATERDSLLLLVPP